MNETTQSVWLQGILQGLGFSFDSPIVIWCDNKSEIKISTDLVQRQKTKHIEIHMHYIRSFVHKEVISLQYFPFAEQTADIFTKILKEKKLTYHISLLGVGETW